MNWTVKKVSKDGHTDYYVKDHNNNTICRAENEADARLIAASPALFRALRDLLMLTKEYNDLGPASASYPSTVLEDARFSATAAIEKALTPIT